MRWFGGKGRSIESIHIVKHARIPLKEEDAVIFLIEVHYNSGLPEMYQLPVAFGKGEFASKIMENCPQAVICRLNIKDEEGILYDAIYGEEFQQGVIRKMSLNQSITLKK